MLHTNAAFFFQHSGAQDELFMTSHTQILCANAQTAVISFFDAQIRYAYVCDEVQ